MAGNAAGSFPRDARQRRCFELFVKLQCVKSGQEENMDINESNAITKLDVERMKCHILDCVAALGVVQQELINPKIQLGQNEDEQTRLKTQMISNTVFSKIAMPLMLTTLVSEGFEKAEHSPSVAVLLKAFPDESKLLHGRSWLQLHWAATDPDSLSIADMKEMYASDPIALQRYHQEGTDKEDMGFTPAHFLCMQTVTNHNMSLIRHFSICNQQAFTMDAKYGDRGEPLLCNYSALHAACQHGQPTEALLKHLLQLDSSQIKKKSDEKGGLTPLGYLCKNSTGNDHLIKCLLEVDSSAEVVGNGIVGCTESTDYSRVLERVEMLLKVNPEASKHRFCS